jgi:hypothetical protein
LELIASCVGAASGGAVTAWIVGFTWLGLVAIVVGAVVGLLVVLGCLFLLYLANSPKGLDEIRQSEIDRLNQSLKELNAQHQSEIEELRRSLEEEQAKNARPEIVGEIRDFIIFPLFSDAPNIEPANDVEAMIQHRPIVTGSDVTILVYLHNVRPVPTTIKEFQLSIEEDGETFIARYADDGGIYQERSGGERVRRLLNLNTLDSKKTLTQGEPLEGALRFLVEGRVPRESQESFNLTLTVTDAFGVEHLISIGGKPPHPADRLLARLEAKEKATRKYIYDSLSDFIKQGRKIEREPMSDHWKPLWGGRVYEFLQNLGGTYATRFENINSENDIALLEEIQREFTD